jgi:hypothetical protein
MTVAHLEQELTRTHDLIGGLELDIGKPLGENR